MPVAKGNKLPEADRAASKRKISPATKPKAQEKVEAEPLDEKEFNKLLKKQTKGKKKQNTRKTAPDPRLDPNIDPKRAKRIIANRESAARSKAKQKEHLESLKNLHQSLTEQKSSIEKEIFSIHADSERMRSDNERLIQMIHCLREAKRRKTAVEEAEDKVASKVQQQ
ncbi:BZIP domain-containing protein [Chloropicon roscoffensis]|uniref:BZIP domain-containing protein n=1 Tax=Chloropicon roscoffensis TaxID=1461544 RepID=A0A7S3C8B5_9CHLO|mmetsp:Transcript_12142/g.36868  ORF Transcript_12142/g.36868 Transcript_12142/m.36868 type:complete len:168 (+) Transcript_12142:205-708(+)